MSIFGQSFLPTHYRQVKFKTPASSGGVKRVAEEEILEVEDLAKKPHKSDEIEVKSASKPPVNICKSAPTAKIGLSSKATLANLVRRKPASTTISTPVNTVAAATQSSTTTASKPATSNSNALSLLSGYDNDSDSNESD